MKLLSVIIPCYNSEEYMRNCIDSLLVLNRNDIEIIIVNDGSRDGTYEYAELYKKQYPGIIKTIHQENGGHGEAINSGLKLASGRYFKVVDSDDWVDREAFEKVVKTLKYFDRKNNEIDMLISNFVYEKEGASQKKVMNYNKMLPENRVFEWDDVKSIKVGKYILMHSVIYRTSLLKEINLSLPKHTFYVDNLFVYIPLIYVKKMYYLSVDFYRYFIGRDDQSVNEQVMIRRIDQQIRVNTLMLEHYSSFVDKIKTIKLKRYMYHYLEIMTSISSILLINSGTTQDLAKKKALWELIKEFDELLYYKLRTRFLGMLVNIPGKLGARISVGVYKLSQKVIGFN